MNVSIHQARLFAVLQKSDWITSKQAAEAAKIHERTSRAHLHKLRDLGIVECAEVFPAHLYRLSAQPNQHNLAHLVQLKDACRVFGVR